MAHASSPRARCRLGGGADDGGMAMSMHNRHRVAAVVVALGAWCVVASGCTATSSSSTAPPGSTGSTGSAGSTSASTTRPPGTGLGTSSTTVAAAAGCPGDETPNQDDQPAIDGVLD